MYGKKAYGVEVSDYGLKNGYLDYLAVSKIIGDCILNNTIRAETMEDWETINGEFENMIFQDYIISEYGFKFLSDFTDEIVFCNKKLDLYIWELHILIMLGIMFLPI